MLGGSGCGGKNPRGLNIRITSFFWYGLPKAFPVRGQSMALSAFRCDAIGRSMRHFLHRFSADECGQDIAEYAVMAGVLVMIVIGIVAAVGFNASQLFFQVSSAIH